MTSTPELSKMEPRAELNEADLDRLGRERPAIFPGLWSELAFCFSIFMSQILGVRLPISLYLAFSQCTF